MRKIDEPLPSKAESKIETKKRLDIINKIKPIIESFAEAVILAGTVAFGKNFSVRKSSDIDLIILINRKEVDKIFESGLFKLTPQYQEAKELFSQKIVDHFSVIKKIDNVEVQLHFWDKEAHFKAELLQTPNPIVYDIWRDVERLSGLDFSGKKRYFELKKIKKYKYGDVHEYPAFFIEEGHFVPRQPLLNLITDPDILFTKDKQLLNNIDKIWINLTKRLIEESSGKIDLNKKSIILSIYGCWNLSPESKEKLEKRQRDELFKLGVIINNASQ